MKQVEFHLQLSDFKHKFYLRYEMIFKISFKVVFVPRDIDFKSETPWHASKFHLLFIKPHYYHHRRLERDLKINLKVTLLIY